MKPERELVEEWDYTDPLTGIQRHWQMFVTNKGTDEQEIEFCPVPNFELIKCPSEDL